MSGHRFAQDAAVPRLLVPRKPVVSMKAGAACSSRVSFPSFWCDRPPWMLPRALKGLRACGVENPPWLGI